MQDVDRLLLKSALELVGELRPDALIICSHALSDLSALKSLPHDLKLIIVTGEEKFYNEAKAQFEHVFRLNADLDRLERVKVATVLCLAKGLLAHGAKVVCLSGAASAPSVDTMMVFALDREKDLIQACDSSFLENRIEPEVFKAILELCIELAGRGREGRPVGATFVVGDHETAQKYSKQLIFNPFKGYSEQERSVINPKLKETIKELSTIDGAFIVSGEGVMISAGSYLNVFLKDVEIPKGCGARWASAAAITSVAKSIALTVSESTGAINIFKNGALYMKIESPRMGKGYLVLHDLDNMRPKSKLAETLAKPLSLAKYIFGRNKK